MNTKEIVFPLLVGSIFVLLFCYCNNHINKVKNEQFYSPRLKLNIPEEPKI